MKASDIFVKALENEGVKYIFGIAGEENLDFLNSLKDSSIEFISTRHEQGAGFMAATYGRLTGTPGVCLSTLGPGAMNLMTSTTFAQLGAMPMVVLTGQKPITKSKQGHFQIIDVVDIMRPVTKYTTQIVHGARIPAAVREAFRIAIEERPGAVHLELPEDIAREEVEEHTFEVVDMELPNADDKAIEKAINLIKVAKMPLLMIGAGANRKKSCEALKQFVEQTDMPFFNTQMGKGVVDERHPNFLGTAALSDHDYIHCAIDKADLIINVGHDVVEKPPFYMKHGGKKVIHINFSAAQVDEVYFPQLNVVGEIANSIDRIKKGLQNQVSWDFSYYRNIKKSINGHLTKYFDDKRFPMLPQRLVHLVRTALPEDGIVTLDNGIYKIWFARNYHSYNPNTLLLDNALASMGAGLPAALAAKMVHPDKKVISVCGDGGFMMNSQELETAIRKKIDVTVIILNDQAYGMIKWEQKDKGFDNYGLEFSNPDFVKYADSFGANGYRPANDAEFREVLQDCLNTDGVHVIDLAIDYSMNHSILNVLIKENKCE